MSITSLLRPRYAVLVARKGHEVFDRLANRSIEVGLDAATAEERAAGLEAAWRDVAQQGLSDAAIEAAVEARLLPRAALPPKPAKPVEASSVPTRVTVSKDVPADRADNVERLIRGWERRAAKLGLAAPVWSLEAPREMVVTVTHPVTLRQYEVSREFCRLTFEGAVPRFSGWALAAKLEPCGPVNLVHGVEGVACPAQYRDRVNVCDHCGTVRRRNETFVLFSPSSGEFKQVGRSCLADFLQSADADDLIAWEQLARGVFGGCDDDADWAPRERDEPLLLAVLAHAALDYRERGYVSSKEESRTSTKAAVQENMHAATSTDPKIRALYKAPSEQDWSLAEAARTHFAGIEPTSDFDRDLHTIARHAVGVSRSSIGKVAYMIAGYSRALARIEEQRLARRTANQHVGSVGQRMKIVAKVERVRTFESDFGDRSLYSMRDAEGNVLSTFSSSGKAREGHVYEMVATVKKHGEYRGTMQTELERVAFGRDVTPLEQLPPPTNEAEKRFRELLAQQPAPYVVQATGAGYELLLNGVEILSSHTAIGFLEAMAKKDPFFGGEPVTLPYGRVERIAGAIIDRSHGRLGAWSYGGKTGHGIVTGRGKKKVFLAYDRTSPRDFVEAVRQHLPEVVAELEAFFLAPKE